MKKYALANKYCPIEIPNNGGKVAHWEGVKMIEASEVEYNDTVLGYYYKAEEVQEGEQEDVAAERDKQQRYIISKIHECKQLLEMVEDNPLMKDSMQSHIDYWKDRLQELQEG